MKRLRFMIVCFIAGWLILFSCKSDSVDTKHDASLTDTTSVLTDEKTDADSMPAVTGKSESTPVKAVGEGTASRERTSPDKESAPTDNTASEDSRDAVPEPVAEKTVIEAVPTENELPQQADHSMWNKLLRQYVAGDGSVDYKGLKSDEALLDEYLDILTATDVAGMSHNQELAFWINAYNAFTVKRVLKDYPVASIRDLDNGNPWDVAWIRLDGRMLSLNNIEHDIIRPEFNEPRIHFAVNCAALSCPPLRNEAYTGDEVNRQLEDQTRSFINNSRYNHIQKNKLELSRIFDWYGEDFPGIISFIDPYTPVNISEDATIGFLEYDWALNDRS